METTQLGGDALAAPFVGFVVGTVFFGVTLLQTYQYFLRYPNDSLRSKVKVLAIFVLDLLHFVFSANLMYHFLILNFGVAAASTKNVWSLKALATTQAILIIFVQSLYLKRIYMLSNVPVLNGRIFSRVVTVVIGLIIPSALAIAIICCYQLLKIKIILSVTGDFAWTVYLAFGSSAVIDIAIASMMCFILHKHRIDIGINNISQSFNRLILNLMRYALATGLLTALASIMLIILFMARPNTLTYISVMFSVPRLYANSVLALLNVRQRHKTDLKFLNSRELMPFSEIVFGSAVPPSSIRSRSRHGASHLNMDVIPRSVGNPGLPRINASSDSESEDDIEAQGKKVQGEKDLFSPYFSPLETRKQMGMLLHVQEPEELHRKGLFDFWKVQQQRWFGLPVDRRSTL